MSSATTARWVGGGLLIRSYIVLASRASPGSHRELYTDYNSRPSFPHNGNHTRHQSLIAVYSYSPTLYRLLIKIAALPSSECIR